MRCVAILLGFIILASVYKYDYNLIKSHCTNHHGVLKIRAKNIPVDIRLFVEYIFYTKNNTQDVYIVYKRDGNIKDTQ